MSWSLCMDRADEQVEMAFTAPDLAEAMRRYRIAAGLYAAAEAKWSERWCLQKAGDCWRAICAVAK